MKLEPGRDLQSAGQSPRRWWCWVLTAAAILLILQAIIWRPLAPPENTLQLVRPRLKKASSTATPRPTPIGLIESFRIVQYRDQAENSALVGEIGVDSAAARENDLVRVVVSLHEPVYCYLIAFNADGTDQLCHPDDDQTAPQRVATLEYPEFPSACRLAEGTGEQAFALIASKEPLPAYGAWRKHSGPAPWQHFDATDVFKFDEYSVRPIVQDMHGGQVERLQAIELFERLCEFLAKQSTRDGLRVLAFPVLAKQPPNTDDR